MLVTIQNAPRELLVTTVTLSKDLSDPEKMLFFRCFRCGNGIDQIQGYVTSLAPGLTPSEDVPVLRKCEKCRELYTFQTHQSRRKSIRFTLSHSLNQMYCVNCRSMLQIPSVFPLTSRCGQCESVYLIDVA